jgi:organic radical activating enzyme
MESDGVQLAKLISKLSSLIQLNIEHPGVFQNLSREISNLFLLEKEKGYLHSVTFDIKPPSAKVDFDIDNLVTTLYILTAKGIHCIIKAVFADEEDLEFIEKCCSLIPWTYKPKWDEVIQGPYLQPCADPSGNIGKISEEMLKKLLVLCTRYGGRLTPQIHKCLNIP